MLHRRLVLSLPLLALSGPTFASWRREVNELRFGASGIRAAELEPALRQRLRVRVTAVPDQGGALVSELNRGHLEFALLDAATLANARSRMRHRLLIGRRRPDGLALVIRRVLPADMRKDLAAALA